MTVLLHAVSFVCFFYSFFFFFFLSKKSPPELLSSYSTKNSISTSMSLIRLYQLKLSHGGESRDILYVYSDRMGKKLVIISLLLSELSYSKVQIPWRFCNKSLGRAVFMHAVFFHSSSRHV